MQWHFGNIGSFIAGLSAFVIAVAALWRGPAAVRAWIAERDAGRRKALDEAEVAREQAETTRLERRRGLSGWSVHGVNSFDVALVTDDDELTRAAHDQAEGAPTVYVTLRASSPALAHALRQNRRA